MTKSTSHLEAWVGRHIDIILVPPVDLRPRVTLHVTGEADVPLNGGDGDRTPGENARLLGVVKSLLAHLLLFS